MRHLQQLGLPDTQEMMDLALAVHAYTLQNPDVYKPLNRTFFSKSRRGKDNAVSEELLAVMPCAALTQCREVLQKECRAP